MTTPIRERPTILAREPAGTTEESRAFLQQRLATAALLMGSLSGGFLLISTVLYFALWQARVGPGYLEEPSFAFHLASTLLMFAIWLCTRRGRWSETALVAIDGMGSGTALLLVALMGATVPNGDGFYHGLLAVCFGLMARAIVVPSSGRKTLIISGAAALAALTATVAVDWTTGATRGLPGDRDIHLLFFGLWLTAAVALATFASRIIFGLQKEVQHSRQVGQYVLKEKIGEGGMGVVYLATHALLRRETAVKLLSSGKVSPTALTRFEREVRQLARLNHPNTVAIYDYGRTPDGVFYYAMEFLEGLDLDQLVDAVGPLPPGRVVHLLTQVCASLTEAHEMGLVHRDIKPANVLVSQHGGIPDTVKVVDFGLVKEMEGPTDVALTAAQGFIGTPLYASPEAIRSPDAVTAAGDLYSVAALGYFLVTGSHVAKATTLVEVCADHLYGEPERPSTRLGVPIPEALENAILVGLAKSPHDRYPSARAFAAALQACPGVAPWTEQDARLWWSSVGRGLLERRRSERARPLS